jgi:hypothetical protein
MLLLVYSAGAAIAEEPSPDPDRPCKAMNSRPTIHATMTNADEEQADDNATVVDDMDDDWVADVVEDDSDDAIPVDLEMDPSGDDWDVIEFADDGDNQEEGADTSTGDIGDPEDIPTIRRPVKGARPQQTAKPGAAGSQDTPYSTGGKPIRADGAPWQADLLPARGPQWAAKLQSGIPLWQLQHYCVAR